MPLILDHAICLRATEYSETSQLIGFLTLEHGRVRTLAKGARRRNKAGDGKCGGGVDQLDVGHAVFAPREGLSVLSEWKLEDGQLPLRKNRRGITLGQHAAETVGMLLEEFDPHPEMFRAFLAALPMLADEAMQEWAGLTLQLDILRGAGLLPEFNQCVETGVVIAEGEPCGFSPLQGGVTTQPAADALPIHPRVRRMLIRLADPADRPRATIARRAADAAHRLLDMHVAAVLGRPLRMAEAMLYQ